MGVLIMYWRTLHYDFVNWDDETYIIDNTLIRDLSWDGWVQIFSTFQVNSTYSPLVLLSWAFDYQFAELNPSQYHLTNVLFHACNAILVFLFVRKLQGNCTISYLVALFFAFHPYQVEVVSWVSARKDLLLVFFYLLGLIAYLNFLEKQKTKWFLITLFMFLMAVLSKGVAVSFPIVLLLLDYATNRLSVKSILSKMPFLVIAIVFSVIAFKGQEVTGAMGQLSDLSIFQRLALASTNYGTFLQNGILPTKFSGFHPLQHNLTNQFPVFYYWFIQIVIGVFFTLMYLFRNNKKAIFGLLFFFTTIFPVIQFFPVGMAHYSERYAYLPFVGLFFLLILSLEKIISRNKSILFIPIALLLFMSFMTNKRIGIWENGKTLWEDVKLHYPKHEIGYINVADFYRKNQNRDKAIEQYNLAIKQAINPNKSYNQLGFIYTSQKNYTKGLTYLNKSIEIDSSYAGAYLNRGVCYLNMKQLNLAKKDLLYALAIDSNLYTVYYNLALIENYQKQYQKSNILINQFLKYNQSKIGYQLVAENHISLKDYENTIVACNQCLQIDKEHLNCYYLKGVALMEQQKFLDAKQCFDDILKLNSNYLEAYLNRGVCLMNLGDFKKSINDFSTVISIDENYMLAYKNRAVAYKNLGLMDEFIQDSLFCINK